MPYDILHAQAYIYYCQIGLQVRTCTLFKEGVVSWILKVMLKESLVLPDIPNFSSFIFLGDLPYFLQLIPLAVLDQLLTEIWGNEIIFDRKKNKPTLS